MSGERSSWDDVDPSKSARRRVRTAEDYVLPAAPHEGLTVSTEVAVSSDFDFDDVGPTEIAAEPHAGAVLEPTSMLDFDEPLSPGKTVGRYRIERTLGQGATGVVYEASHVIVGRRVALKCLFPHMAAQPVQVQRLFREAKISARVEHDNVVQIFDGGREGETYFLAMELLQGRTFGDVIEEGPCSVSDVVEIMLQVMSGVAAVHDEGVIHRDLKPDNIFMHQNPDEPGSPGTPKVLDFGVSKLKEPGLQSSKLTAMGMVMGTPYYMAPEQVADTSGVDLRADVYSLGVILYEALAGQLPHTGHSVIEIFTRAMEGRPTPLRELRPEVPPALEALVKRAMSPDKEARFASVHEMRAALDAVTVQPPVELKAWSDCSQPWSLDKESGIMRKRDLKPVEPRSSPSASPLPDFTSGPALLTNPESPIVAPEAPESGLPTWIGLAIAALLGGLTAAGGAWLLYFLLA